MKERDRYSDDEIIQKIMAGEFGLFEILIRRNNPYLYKTGRAYNFSHEDTQDLMQDTFIDAYMHLSGFENRSSFRTWIIKIMLNNCYRKKQKWSIRHITSSEIEERSVPIFSNHALNDTNRTVMNRELNHVIENALQSLPMEHKMVFTLREMNGLSVAETASVLNISEANVKVRLNRAKALLRKEVERSYSAKDIFEFNLIYCDDMVKNVMDKIRHLNNKVH